MLIVKYATHLIVRVFKNKKIWTALVIGLLLSCSLLFHKEIKNVFLPGYSFDDSIEYCNSPHKVSGEEGIKDSEFRLKQVQILIRHGDRAPIDLQALPNTTPVQISCFFNKAGKEYSVELERFREVVQRGAFQIYGSKIQHLIKENFFCSGGQLTPFGYLQHIFLGEYMKYRYDDFFEKVDVINEVLVKSTDVSRTIQSSAALLTGMFYEKLKPASKPVAINVYKDVIEEGHLILDETNQNIHCSTINEIRSEYLKNSTYIKFYQSLVPLYESFAEVLSVNKKYIPRIGRIVDVLYARLCHNQGIPYGPHMQIPSTLVEQAFHKAHIYFTLTSSVAAEHQTLSILSQIAAQSYETLIKLKADSKKVVIYSGHDSMITPALVLLGINDNRWPPYASRIVFEIYQKNEIQDVSVRDLYVRVLYNGKVMKNLSFCTVSSSNGELCSILDLYRYVSQGSFDPANEIFDMSIFFKRIADLCGGHSIMF